LLPRQQIPLNSSSRRTPPRWTVHHALEKEGSHGDPSSSLSSPGTSSSSSGHDDRHPQTEMLRLYVEWKAKFGLTEDLDLRRFQIFSLYVVQSQRALELEAYRRRAQMIGPTQYQQRTTNGGGRKRMGPSSPSSSITSSKLPPFLEFNAYADCTPQEYREIKWLEGRGQLEPRKVVVRTRNDDGGNNSPVGKASTSSQGSDGPRPLIVNGRGPDGEDDDAIQSFLGRQEPKVTDTLGDGPRPLIVNARGPDGEDGDAIQSFHGRQDPKATDSLSDGPRPLFVNARGPDGEDGDAIQSFHGRQEPKATDTKSDGPRPLIVNARGPDGEDGDAIQSFHGTQEPRLPNSISDGPRPLIANGRGPDGEDGDAIQSFQGRQEPQGTAIISDGPRPLFVNARGPDGEDGDAIQSFQGKQEARLSDTISDGPRPLSVNVRGPDGQDGDAIRSFRGRQEPKLRNVVVQSQDNGPRSFPVDYRGPGEDGAALVSFSGKGQGLKPLIPTRLSEIAQEQEKVKEQLRTLAEQLAGQLPPASNTPKQTAGTENPPAPEFRAPSSKNMQPPLDPASRSSFKPSFGSSGSVRPDNRVGELVQRRAATFPKRNQSSFMDMKSRSESKQAAKASDNVAKTSTTRAMTGSLQPDIFARRGSATTFPGRKQILPEEIKKLPTATSARILSEATPTSAKPKSGERSSSIVPSLSAGGASPVKPDASFRDKSVTAFPNQRLPNNSRVSPTQPRDPRKNSIKVDHGTMISGRDATFFPNKRGNAPEVGTPLIQASQFRDDPRNLNRKPSEPPLQTISADAASEMPDDEEIEATAESGLRAEPLALSMPDGPVSPEEYRAAAEARLRQWSKSYRALSDAEEPEHDEMPEEESRTTKLKNELQKLQEELAKVEAEVLQQSAIAKELFYRSLLRSQFQMKKLKAKYQETKEMTGMKDTTDPHTETLPLNEDSAVSIDGDNEASPQQELSDSETMAPDDPVSMDEDISSSSSPLLSIDDALRVDMDEAKALLHTEELSLTDDDAVTDIGPNSASPQQPSSDIEKTTPDSPVSISSHPSSSSSPKSSIEDVLRAEMNEARRLRATESSINTENPLQTRDERQKKIRQMNESPLSIEEVLKAEMYAARLLKQTEPQISVGGLRGTIDAPSMSQPAESSMSQPVESSMSINDVLRTAMDAAKLLGQETTGDTDSKSSPIVDDSSPRNQLSPLSIEEVLRAEMNAARLLGQEAKGNEDSKIPTVFDNSSPSPLLSPLSIEQVLQSEMKAAEALRSSSSGLSSEFMAMPLETSDETRPNGELDVDSISGTGSMEGRDVRIVVDDDVSESETSTISLGETTVEEDKESRQNFSPNSSVDGLSKDPISKVDKVAKKTNKSKDEQGLNIAATTGTKWDQASPSPSKNKHRKQRNRKNRQATGSPENKRNNVKASDNTDNSKTILRAVKSDP